MFFDTTNATMTAASEIEPGAVLFDNIDPAAYVVTSVQSLNEWTTKLHFDVLIDEAHPFPPHNPIVSLEVANNFLFPIQK